ncbi:MAG: hypothetical protein ILNGONEN_01994 [Syntrophorhabdaceae bacterium]|nr:hypothetical protein [Syntrophorhabdaceae bacterium]
MMKIITKFLLCSTLLLSSVDHDSLASPAPNGSSVAADSLEVLYPAVFHEILHHLLTQETVIAGDYQGDFGDATCYAPPVLLANGLAIGDSTQIELARTIMAREYTLIHNFLFNSSEALIGGLGLTEVYGMSPETRLAEETRALLSQVDSIYDLFNENGLLPKNLSSDYGQTASTAIIAALQLKYLIKIDSTDGARRERALTMVKRIEAAAYDSAGFYRWNADDTELTLYPNAAMMLVHSLAYHVTRDDHHLNMARSLLPAIAPLFRPELDAYLYRKSDPNEYISLSSHNYLALALLHLFDETQDGTYLRKAQRTVDFIITRLYNNGIVYHDLRNNVRANYYCTGCNFQFLFVLWQAAIATNQTAVLTERRSVRIPDEVWLSPNYPNPFGRSPFNPETAFEYHLPHAAQVFVAIFNLQGQQVATLAQGARTAGIHKVRWNGRDGAGQPVASGVYLYQLQADNFVAVKKALLLR